MRVPPLRERIDDLPLLVEPLLASLRVQRPRPLSGLSAGFFDKLARHAWPGNVRELQHVLYQAAFVEDEPILTGREFDPAPTSLEGDLPEPTRDKESRLRKARAALQAANGNKRRAAERLGISRKTLYAWLAEPRE